MIVLVTALIASFVLYFITILIIKKISNKEEIFPLQILGSILFSYVIFSIIGFIMS